MINQINASFSTGSSYKSESGQASAAKNIKKTATSEDPAYVLDITGADSGETKSHGLGTDELQAVKEQADLSTASLRELVQKLIVQQQENSPTFNISIQILGSGSVSMTQAEAQAAIGEDGEWGVKAVSDRIVEFAKSVSGGDVSKLSELKDAIDRGFAGAKRTLGGSLPDISNQTYDAIMSKLDDWANADTETAAAE